MIITAEDVRITYLNIKHRPPFIRVASVCGLQPPPTLMTEVVVSNKHSTSVNVSPFTSSNNIGARWMEARLKDQRS
jgi:hypothetical protein